MSQPLADQFGDPFTDPVSEHTAPRPLGPPPSSPPPAAPPYAPPEPRRFMTATDFLDRRDSEKELGPASWGWRGRVRRWSGGLITPAMGPKERAFEADRSQIQKDFDGPRTIAFVNPKGGAAKTTGVLAAGHTFGTVRGGGVVAWDNNETRGTLGIRGARSTHRNTTRELLEDLDRFKDVYQARIGDLGAFVRSQGDAHFDVLASDERPDVTGVIHARDFTEVHSLLERFYRVILVDTGNNLRAENWLAAAETADLLVVTSTIREDTGYSGLWIAGRPPGRRLRQPEVQDDHRALGPEPEGRRGARARPRRRLRAAHPRRLPGAVRPGPRLGIGGAVRRAFRGDAALVAAGVCRNGRRVVAQEPSRRWWPVAKSDDTLVPSWTGTRYGTHDFPAAGA